MTYEDEYKELDEDGIIVCALDGEPCEDENKCNSCNSIQSELILIQK